MPSASPSTTAPGARRVNIVDAIAGTARQMLFVDSKHAMQAYKAVKTLVGPATTPGGKPPVQ